MLHEKLIELVREHVALYDTTHKRYSDSNYKERLWREIGFQLKEPASHCKKTWTGLRDSYRRAVKRKKEAKSGGATSKYKIWKFEEEMSFLESYISERPTKSSLNVDLTEDATKETTEYEARLGENAEGELFFNEANIVNVSPEINFLPSSSKYCKKAKTIETVSSSIMKYLKDEQKKDKKEQSSIRSFFLSMADTAEKFSPYNQHKAKSRIFSIVSEIEYEELTKNDRPQFHPVKSWEDESLQTTNNY